MKKDRRRGDYKLSWHDGKKKRLTSKTWKTKRLAKKHARQDNKMDPSGRRRVVKYR